MFFLLSKILDFLISPITWIVVVLAIAVFTKNAHRKRKTLIISFACLLFFSNPLLLAIFRNLIPSCERIISDNNKEHFHAAVLMGGMISYDESKDRILFNANINRLTQTVELYKKGVVNKILITGGSGSILYPKKREANLLKNYLIEYFNLPEKGAQACFEKQGYKTYIYAPKSKKNSLEKVLPKNLFLPQAEILLEWNNFLHELIGVITYKIAGYI